ncbi:MAG: RNA polymerase sigma factor [Gemmatimonadota bacterium]|nr:RNA polymerase sigma factor [Gemmatimonadota bacterium]
MFTGGAPKQSRGPGRPIHEAADRTGEEETSRRAFDEIYERHVDRVYAICLRLSGDPGRAETLTQDVFVRAWRKLDTFRGESRLSTWLHRIAVNLALDDQRKRKRERARLADLERSDLPPTLARQTETKLALERAVAKLPDRARTALVLHAIEGYKYREIAEMMEVAIGTVKAHVHRARQRLLEEMDR